VNGCGDEISNGIRRVGQRDDASAEQVEGAHDERLEEGLLGAEAAEHRPSRGAHLFSNPAHRQRVHAVGVKDRLCGVEQRGGGRLVVVDLAGHAFCDVHAVGDRRPYVARDAQRAAVEPWL
jgi:hypothetical protein